MDEDRRNALLLYALIGSVVLFALALIAYGYYQDRIAPNRETVLTVGERKFDVAFLERRIRANFKLGNAPPSATLQDLVVQSLQSIELEEVARRTAETEGLNISSEDIDNEIKSRVGLPNEAPRNAFAAAYRADVLRSGLPVKEYREIVEAQVVERVLQSKYREVVPASAEHVDAQILRVSAESRAREAKQKINGGQSFSLTAIEFSLDESKEAGGEIGWVTRPEMLPKVGELLFTLPPGQVSEPFQDRGGWYLVVPRARETRDIDPDRKVQIASRMFDNKVLETRDAVGSTNKLTEEQILRIGNKLLGG